MVLAKGDATAGAILLLLSSAGTNPRFFERGLGTHGNPALIASGPRESPMKAEVTAYWRSRRSRDSDLWVIELDIAGAERFAAETMGMVDFAARARERPLHFNSVVPLGVRESNGYAVGGEARRS
jgi:hypothetical protein